MQLVLSIYSFFFACFRFSFDNGCEQTNVTYYLGRAHNNHAFFC
jgi:hypothetical protein